MKTKHYLHLASILLMSLCSPYLLTACSGGDDDSDDPNGGGGGTSNPTIVLRTQSIQEGAEVDAATTTVLTLGYNTTVKPVTGGDITLNGTKVQATSNSKTKMDVDIPLELEEGKSYTLKVAKGAIVSSDGKSEAPAFTLNFTTKAKQQPVNPDIASAPVNANATEAAKSLYTYFKNQYGQKVISSVMADVNWNTKLAEKVHTLTGKYPAMNCFDFIHICYSPANWIDYTNISPVQEWVNAGGIVQLMWHFNVPKKGSETEVTCTPKETDFRASNVFTEGSWENKWFYEQMDKVVDVMLKLQDAGIAATWRPFHEAAGNATAKQQADWTKAWFWWGYDGADTYKRLWITMYDYFQQKGVNNLIWIWTTQNYNGDSEKYNQDTDWYPGDQYVDIVARDLYGRDAATNGQEFTEIQATYPNKMVVLGECGYGNGNEQGKISDCWASGAKWGHFMVWYQGGQGSTDTMCSDAWWTNAMSSDEVITRDEAKF